MGLNEATEELIQRLDDSGNQSAAEQESPYHRRRKPTMHVHKTMFKHKL